MKISLNHIRFYRDMYKWSDDPAPHGVDELVAKIGTQLGAVEEVVQLGKRYERIVIVKIVHCTPHADSDHLNICKVDDGHLVQDVERDEEGLVQVITGAPNVRDGLLVAWLPPGSTVPSTADTDPFVLEARTMRGEVSNGMLASARELGIGDDHTGILELESDEQVKPGVWFAEAAGLKGDVIIDIENKMFTHRPDCFGMMGVARELAGIQGQAFHSPEWYKPSVSIEAPEPAQLLLEVHNELPQLVPRFIAIPLSGVTIKPSPLWLQVSLSRLGVRPINNIVDITNYYMLLTGQPTHAYDYDKVRALSGGDAAIITVRHPHESEKLVLLNGKEIQPRTEAIMIATDKQLIGVGGVMGGADTEVDDTTKNIILEVATFDMYSIRRTSMEHGIFSDAVTRFNKGQSPLQNPAVAGRIVQDMIRLAGAMVAGPMIDDNRLPEEVTMRDSLHPPVTVTTGFINARLGLELSAGDMRTLLTNVEFAVDVHDNELTVTAPFWRTDIEIPEDIVEEVGRLYGYDRLPLDLPRRDLMPAVKNPKLELQYQVRDILADAGASELVTYSFVHGNLLDKVGQSRDKAFQLSNALSPDLQYYRLSLAPSLLEKVHANLKAGHEQFVLFEIGKVHQVGVDEDGLPKEMERLALVYAADDKQAAPGAAYYKARVYLDRLLYKLGLSDIVTYEPLTADESDQATTYYAAGRAATVKLGDTVLGRIGEYSPAVHKALKLPAAVAGFEIGLAPIAAQPKVNRYAPLPRFPRVEQDICLKVPMATPYAAVYSFVQEHLHTNRPDQTHLTLTPLDIYQRDDDPDHKQITLRLRIASYDRTLTDSEVAQLLDTAAAAAQQALQAERI